MSRRTCYTALGSSFGAGPGLQPRVPGSPLLAGRSTLNYAHLLARDLDLDLADATFSGATIGDILRLQDNVKNPQLSSVTAETTLVSITGGGNDVGYLPALTFASNPALLAALFRARTHVREATDAATVLRRFTALDEDLGELITAIHTRAPRARVVVVGYLTILPPAGIDTGALPAEVAEWGREVARRLSDTMRAATLRAGADFVDVGAASLTHHAWSSDPWTNRFHLGFRGGAAYHPKLAGMAEVARMVRNHLGDAGWPPREERESS